MVTSTTSTATDHPDLDLESFERACLAMAPEPIGEWMRTQGKPPGQWLLWLPTDFRQHDDALFPSYVRFSRLIDRPVFVPRGMVF